MVNNTMLTNSSYKFRLAQDITLYLGDIGVDIDIDGDAGKKTWLEDEAWQGVRKAVEAIMAATDYIEVYFAVNVVYEALVGELFRSGFIMRAGAAHNDYVTPAVISAAESDYQRNLANTVSLLSLLTSDAEHGTANKEIMQGWLTTYVPLCTVAADQLQAVWSIEDNSDLDFGSVFTGAKDRFKSILSAIDVDLPEGTSL
jgi:propane monooxygenase small subunit